MTIIYVLIIIAQLGVIFYFVRKGKTQSSKYTQEVTAGSFENLRAAAMGIKPEQLKLAIPDSQTFVYGVTIDWNMGDEIVTLATYITGAANLYLSKGGGVSGAGLKPNVGEAAVKLVNAAQDFLPRAMPSTGKDMPQEKCVRFNLLTNKSIFSAQEHVQYFDDGSSPWLTLFQQGNEVIAEMRN